MIHDKIVFWIKDIVEDDPIPYEIRYMYFTIMKMRGDFFLMLGGTELERSEIFSFEYFPLEAQYFYDKGFSGLISERLMIELLEKVLEDKMTQKIFEGKEVFVGYYGQKPFHKF